MKTIPQMLQEHLRRFYTWDDGTLLLDDETIEGEVAERIAALVAHCDWKTTMAAELVDALGGRDYVDSAEQYCFVNSEPETRAWPHVPVPAVPGVTADVEGAR